LIQTLQNGKKIVFILNKAATVFRRRFNCVLLLSLIMSVVSFSAMADDTAAKTETEAAAEQGSENRIAQPVGEDGLLECGHYDYDDSVEPVAAPKAPVESEAPAESETPETETPVTTGAPATVYPTNIPTT